MPVALTGPEWGVLLVSVVPAFLAVAAVYAAWRWAKRDEASQTGEAEQRDRDDNPA